jgi:hypothetical protein
MLSQASHGKHGDEPDERHVPHQVFSACVEDILGLRVIPQLATGPCRVIAAAF